MMQDITEIIRCNAFNHRAEARQLVWGNKGMYQDITGVVDVIIAADWYVLLLRLVFLKTFLLTVYLWMGGRWIRWSFSYDLFPLCSLFLEQYHTELLDTLQSVLKPAGMAIFMAPLRNNSLINFTKMAKQRNFQVSVEENYDPIIQDQHNQFITTKDLTYTPDIHYPLLVKVCTPSWSVLVSHNLIKGQ